MKTIVLVHGFWVTPRSWEHWIDRYQRAGYNVIAPAYPGFEVEVEALNVDPTPIEALTAPAIVSHLESVVGALDEPPILMGHSAGGAFTQVLLDHGFGAAGVAINSAPTEGVRVIPLFANTFTEEEPLELYQRYHVPASGRIFWNSVLANFEPGPQDVHVDYHNDDRPPLLFVSGSEDHLMPPSVQRSNAKHYKSSRTITEIVEYQGMPPLLPAQKGWEEVADHALAWAVEHAGWPAATGA